MLRTTLVLLAAGAVSGCAASASFTPSANSSTATNTELAAYAGHDSYPTTMPTSTDLKAAALVSPDQKTLKVYNFGTQVINDADIWVNGSYVYHVDSIAPEASVTIASSDLFNGVGASLASQQTPISRVQVKTNNELYNLWGPAAL